MGHVHGVEKTPIIFFLIIVARKTARNFNPPMCKAAKVCIAEVEEIVDVGEIEPENVHIPSIYVDKVLLAKKMEKRIEVKSS